MTRAWPTVEGRSLTGSSDISIADALEDVKDAFSDVLPMDVMDHFNRERRNTKDSQYLQHSQRDTGNEGTIEPVDSTKKKLSAGCS